MKHKKKLLITGTILLALGIGITYESIQTQDAHAALGGNDGTQVLTTEHRDNGVTNRPVRTMDEPPTYITFNDGTAQKNRYDSLGISQIWEQHHMNRFTWYSITEDTPAEQRNDNLDHSAMYENNVARPNLDYAHLVKRQTGLWQNLKWGSSDPDIGPYPSNFNGQYSGTTTITNTNRLSEYFGKKLEWRFLGYTTNGVATDNPYFPADYPSEGWDPKDKDWWTYPWLAYDGHSKKVEAGPYDVIYPTDPNAPGYEQQRARFEQKVQWFIKYLFPAHPEMRRPQYDLWTDAANWAKVLTLKNNPDWSTGIVTGWHGSGYYATFAMESPKRNNMRVIEYKVTNKSGQVVGLHTGDPNNNDNISEKWEVNNQYVSAGETLTITAKVKNMDQRPSYLGRATRYTPIRMMQMVAYDEDSLILGKWSTPITEDVIPGVNEDPATRISNIQVGQTVTFDKTKNDDTGQIVQWEYKVPSTIREQFVLGAEISPGFKASNDNVYTDDDDGRLRFWIKQEDIGLVCESIELINDEGQVTNDIVPGMSHDVRIKVKKTEGNRVVGVEGDYYNPFAAVSASFNDTASVYKDHEKVSATQSLTKQGDTTVITIHDAITPLVPTIKADINIHWFNASPDFGNQSSDRTNDSCSKVWRSKNNLSVSNFKILPSSAIGANSTIYENLDFSFTVTNTNPENQTKNVRIEIRDRNGNTVMSGTESIPANEPYVISWSKANVPLMASTNGTINPFVVEVNPPPRQIIESSPDMANPYSDNIANNSVMGYRTDPNPKNCLVVNTRNDWQETHYFYQREGWYHSTEWGGHCHTDYSNSWSQTYSYNETYKITNVMFRSKLTKDTLGGDGWVDLLSNPSQAKVKAGYGFEIYYVVKYDTNYYRSSPKGWTSGICSYLSVNRQYTAQTTAPTTLYVKMPFKDDYGNSVTYTLSPTSQTGSWDALTQKFEMPMHNAFNLKNTREVFVNETAKDGTYNMEVNTYPYFYGSPYKSSQSTFLCDQKTIPIRVVGANSDDLKSHVTQ